MSKNPGYRYFEVCGTMVEVVPVGTKVWFRSHVRPFKVIASNRFYSVCTKPFNAKKTVIYTVVDWRNKFCGTENTLWGGGAETEEECQEMLHRITSGKSDISSRNWAKLDVVKLVFPKKPALTL